jgi:hypothetical protein
MNPSVRTIIDLNIRRYRELLKKETDPTKRQTIAMLLVEEEAKLAKLLTEQTRTPRGSTRSS